MLIALILSIAYLAGVVSVWRHLGYRFDRSMFAGKFHEFQNICGACECRHCGDSPRHHDRGRWRTFGCDNYERKRIHYLAVIWAFVVSMVGWIPIAGLYGMHLALAKCGIDVRNSFDFFTPAPSIETPARKRERLLVEREAKIEALEAENESLRKAQESPINNLRDQLHPRRH